MRPLPLVFVLPRDWETVDFFPFVSFFSSGCSFSGLGGWGKARKKLVEWNRCHVLGTVRYRRSSDAHDGSRGIRLRGRTLLLVSFASRRFFQRSGIPAAARAGRRAARFAFLMPFDTAAKNLVRSRRCRPAGRRLGSEAVNLAGDRWRNLS